MEEIWKAIEGYENKYEVSSLGRVRSYKPSKNDWQILKPRTSKSKGLVTGYLRVGLRKNNIFKIFCIHKLVAKAFIPNPENKPQVDHIDGNIFNNTVDNLRWATQKENNNNPVSLNKHRKYLKPILCIETGIVYKNMYEIIDQLGIPYTTIYNCVISKINKTMSGYHWKFVE